MEKLKVFDAYPKAADEYRVRTMSGAVLSVICGVLIVLLVGVELRGYRSLEVLPEITVDGNVDEQASIYFNVTFPYIPCSFLEVDNLDVAGVCQLNPTDTIVRMRLDVRGHALKPQTVSAQSTTKRTAAANANANANAKAKAKEGGGSYCGPCYGAETQDNRCCNTCDEVKRAYKNKGWTPRPVEFEQCAAEVLTQEMLEQRDAGEGCNVAGSMTVNKVAGNFHIAPGRSQQVGSFMHVHDFQHIALNVNVTHTIHQLAFGRPYPGVVNPLDGHTEVDLAGASMVQYFVKVVPTTYTFLDGTSLSTNQYSVTEHNHHVELASAAPNGLPGFFVLYDMSPITVRFTEVRKSFMHFLTNVCAIIGGVITVASVLDSIIYRRASAAQRQPAAAAAATTPAVPAAAPAVAEAAAL